MRLAPALIACLGFGGLAPVALAADVSEPAPTLLNSGYVELNASYTFLGDDFGTEDEDFFAGGAALYWNLPLTDAASLQLDLLGEATDNMGENDESSYEGSGTAALHLSMRDPASYLLGVFGGGVMASTGDNGDISAFFVGGEGQFYWDRTTFYGQAGFLDGGENGSDDPILNEAFFARLQVRHYLSDNTRLAAQVAYANGEVDEESNTDVFDWGAELEHKLDSFPLSVFAAYEGMHMDQNPGEDDRLTEHVAKIGFRYDFGASSIMERDRYGAALDLPRFGRWLGEASGPLE